jgi:molecular chaperone DnaJ
MGMGSTAIEDYYAVLGVPREISPAELRRAYRKLALRYHPDRAGEGSTAAFQRISRAYEVLSDPQARESYDRRLRYEERKSSPPPPPAPARSEANPSPAPKSRQPKVLLTRLSGPLNSLIACGIARREEDGTIELRLSEEDLLQGGYATISTRARISCRACGGSAERRASCQQCQGEGTALELVSAWLTIPPQVTDGTVLSVSVDPRLATAPLKFRLRTPGAVAVS